MNAKKDYQFFTNVSDIENSSICSVPNNTSILVLEITSSTTPTFTLHVGGTVNENTTTFTALGATNMSTGMVSSNITAVGIYQIIIDGLSNVEVMLTAISDGAISVYGKFGNKYYM